MGKTGISLANAYSAFIALISVSAAEACKAGLDSLRSTYKKWHVKQSNGEIEHNSGCVFCLYFSSSAAICFSLMLTPVCHIIEKPSPVQ